MKYFNIDWSSQKDGPGTRVVLYLQGCPLHCIWCHSPHSQPIHSSLLFFEEYCTGCKKCKDVCVNGCHIFYGNIHIIQRQNCSMCKKCVLHCQSDALCLDLYEETAEMIFHRLEPELKLLRNIGGITVSGGEPLLQADELKILLKACKLSGYNTAVETSGYADRVIFERLAEHVDCWLFGLKHTDMKKCRSLTGADFNIIYGNLSFLAEYAQEKIIIRVPVLSGFNDDDGNIKKTAGIMQSLGLNYIELLPYNPYTPHYYKALGRKFDKGRFSAPSEKHISDIVGVFKNYGISARVIIL